jgi:hypothetical protein
MAIDQNATTAEASPGFLSDFSGMFNFLMDPGGAAKRLPRKFFWIAPLILVSAIFMACGFLNLPLVQQAMMNQPPPPNANPEQFQKGMQMAMMFQRAGIYLSPLIFLVISALSALIVLATASVLGLKARFLELFNLMSGLSLIGALKVVATTVILHLKGEPSSLADLQPPLGLDIFAPVGMSKVLVAFLGFCNIFELWQFVMAVAIIVVFYRASIGKAVISVVPVFLVALLLSLVGAFFTRAQ